MKPFGWMNGIGVVAITLGVTVTSCSLQRGGQAPRLLPATEPAGATQAPSALPTAAGKQELPAPEPARATKATVQATLGKLPLYFIENHGQLDNRVAYYVQGHDTTLYFTAEGLTLALSSPASQPPSPPGPKDPLQPVAWKPAAEPSSAQQQRYVLKLDFVGANPQVKPSGQELTPAVISYFKGPKEQWKTGLPTYASVVYPELWPGIDLVYSGTGNHLKYTFVVQPGADPQQIQLAYQGATGVRLTEGGQLEVVTPVGNLEDARPQAYQEGESGRVEVATAYELEAPGREGAYRYGFRVGAYDRSKALVIDPAVLLYAGYIGGGGDDVGSGIAVDSLGNAYITGTTTSPAATFPVTVGPDLTFNGGVDAFVAKVRADGAALDYAGYIGGIGKDYGYGIAVDSAGNAYVTGYTSSTAATFPVTVGPDLTYNGSGDAFVAKVQADGKALLYAGYIGGGGYYDYGTGIAVDSAGNAYVTGYTNSTEATFPVTVGPDLTFNGGSSDAFVAKVRADGTALVYAGYIGGSSIDHGSGIAVDSAGNAYVTGKTYSTAATFPVTVGPDLTANGFEDAFIAKVRADGTALVYAGYIGGGGFDYGNGIAVDSAGNAYVTGYTGSTAATFPVTVGPDLTFNGGGKFEGDAFVAKVRADGTALDYAGYIGGSSNDYGSGIAVDSAGNAYVTGYTASTEASFPVTMGPDLTYNGGDDAFIAKVRADGTALDYAGYLGGSGGDYGYGIAVDSAGNAYVTGYTGSTEATFPITMGPDLIHNGSGDAFVAKIGEPPSNCGNGVVDSDEQCDLGENNGKRLFCCSATCQLEPSDFVCRPAVGACDMAEFCIGISPFCPADSLKAAGTACPDDGNVCTLDQCDGTSPACQHPAGNAGTACPDDGEVCTLDQCDGTSSACQHPAGKAGTRCRLPGACIEAAFCTGTSASCPASVFKAAGTACPDDGNVCTLDQCNGTSRACQHPAGNAGTACPDDGNVCTLDQCNGTSPACQHPAGNGGMVCRPAYRACDVAETCTGTSASCPANGLKAAGTVCRAARDCDGAGICSGTSRFCPTNFKAAGTLCRAAAGPCDVTESCTGTSPYCPANTFKASTTVCRAAAGVCDVAESCTGTSAACPADIKSTAVCRPSAGACDIAERCDGVNNSCPANTFKASTTLCRSAIGACDVTERCSGTNPYCPANTYKASTTVCRPAAGTCDVAEKCLGSSPYCPANGFRPDGTACSDGDPATCHDQCTAGSCEGTAC